MVINKNRNKQLKKGWFEQFIDDTNIIEKLIFLIWFGMIGIFYIMFDMFDILIRKLISNGKINIVNKFFKICTLNARF